MQLSAGYFVRKSEFLVLLHRGEKNTGHGYTTLISLGTEPPPPRPPKTRKIVYTNVVSYLPEDASPGK